MLTELKLHSSYHAGLQRVGIKLAILAVIMLFVWWTPMPENMRGIAGYAPLHGFFETVSIVISGLIFAVIWNALERRNNQSALLLACGFIGVALLDFSHMISIRGMPDYVIPSSPEKAINFWLAARLLGAMTLLLVVVNLGKKSGSVTNRSVLLAGVLTVVALLHWLFLYHADLMPRTFIEGQGLTYFKRGVEYFIIALNLAAMVVLLMRMREPLQFDAPLLLGALCTSAMSEFLFTLYSQLADVYLVMGHLYKIIAYIFIYQAVFVEVIYRPYREISSLKDRLNHTQAIASLGSWELNLITNNLTWSDEVYRLFGLQPNEFPATYEAFLAHVHPEDRAAVDAAYTNSVRNGSDGYEIGHRIVRQTSGEVRFVHEKCEHTKDANGQVVRSIGMVHDITELKQTEIELNESQLRLKAIIEASPVPLAINDDRGNITYLNHAFINTIGYTLNDIPTLADWWPRAYPDPEYRQQVADAWQNKLDEARRNNQPFSPIEFNITCKDGSVRTFIVGASKLADRFDGTHLITLFDITDRIRIDQMKNEFISTISHELRTPLTSISGALGLIAGGVLGEMPAKPKQMIDVAHRNSLRLGRLVNDLLDMEKLLAGKTHFDMQRQALMPLLEQAIEGIRSYGADRRVALSLSLAGTVADVEVKVNVDSQRFLQVMSNLLSNAIKYSPDDSTVEIGVQIQNGSVRVTVTDHGPGIPAEFRERIFQKFSQADSSDTRQTGGTGLGLAITRELVQHMGGQIGYVSVEGKGASFYFDLPVVRA